MPPTLGNGKICYIEIPALDIRQSAAFYQKTFGWNIREDNAGNISFDDAVGEVSGMWVTGRKPATEQGFLISIMVNSIETTVKKIIANGGKIVQPIDEGEPAITALFSDPAGNVFCLYQEQT
ncbi:MAG: VOC family protein [Bacteroidota bacterium]|nr:VOC family protein [Bacteroidota bacterium]